MKSLSESELILNEDGSIYHLCLKPGELAPIIFSVGDPQRVNQVSQYFDSVDLIRHNREFLIHTGILRGKPVSVLSTGMGTDNIDIVWNEVDALFNIDFKKRQIKNDIQQIKWIRLGTSGSIQNNIPVGTLLYSQSVLGLEGLLNFYQSPKHPEEALWQAKLAQIVPDLSVRLFDCSSELESQIRKHFVPGLTATLGGFYAPQGRTLRAASRFPGIMDQLAALEVNRRRVSNMEMETAGIYGIASLLNHRAISLNAIIANRATGEFSTRASDIVNDMIIKALNALV